MVENETAKQGPDEYAKVTTERITGLESQMYFFDNVKSGINKNTRAGKELGLVALVIDEQPENLLDSFLQEISAGLRKMSGQYDHATFYRNKFVLARRISTIEENQALSAELNSIVQQPAQDYQLTYRINSALVNDAKDLQKVVDEITQ